MRHTLKFVFVFAVLVFIISGSLSSCKQCNKPVEPPLTAADTTGDKTVLGVTEMLKGDSLNPMLWFKRAKLYEATGDYKSAATDMFYALLLDSMRPEFYMYTAALWEKGGDIKRAIATMQKGIAMDSLNIPYYIEASKYSYIDSNYVQAFNFLNAAIDKDPMNPEIYFFKGLVFKETGNIDKAVSSFQTAVEMNPKYYEAYVQIGLLLQRKKDKNAEKYLDNAIKVSDKPEDALMAKGYIQQQDKNYAGAIASYKRVVELNYRNEDALYNIGICYIKTDSFDVAYKYFDLVTKTQPTNPEAHYHKGLCAEAMGNKEEAMELYQNAINISEHKKAAERLAKLRGS